MAGTQDRIEIKVSKAIWPTKWPQANHLSQGVRDTAENQELKATVPFLGVLTPDEHILRSGKLNFAPVKSSPGTPQ